MHRYEDKLANYYDLCRKNIGANSSKQESLTKEDKFTRNEGKTKKLKLDEALKILSFD